MRVRTDLDESGVAEEGAEQNTIGFEELNASIGEAGVKRETLNRPFRQRRG